MWSDHSLGRGRCARGEASERPLARRRGSYGFDRWLGIVLQWWDDGGFGVTIRFRWGMFLISSVDVSLEGFKFPEQLLLVLER